MADDPQLVVAITARLDQFEKQLKAAGLIAEREVRNIETRMGTIAGGTALGNLLAAGIQETLKAIIEELREAHRAMLQLDDAAKRTGLTFKEIQQLAGVGIMAGLTRGQAVDELNRLQQKLEEAGRNVTALTKLFHLNNIPLREANGQIISANKGLEAAATLMARARTESEKIEIARIFGISEKWRDVLGEGADAMRRIKDNMPAEDLEKAVQKTRALESIIRRIGVETATWGSVMAQIVVPILQTALLLVEAFVTKLADIGAGMADKTGITDWFVELETRLKRLNKDIEEIVANASRTRIVVTKGVGVQFPEQRNALIAQEQLLQKRIALLQEEARLVAASTREKEGAKAVTELVTAAERAQIPVTDELMKKFAGLGAAYGQAAQDAAIAKAQFEEMNNASKEFGSALADAFKAATLEGKKLDEIMKSLVNRLASRSIDRLFDLFFAPTPGAGGTSIFTQLLKGLTGRQHGGPVAAGRGYMVGERGPELFIPNRNGMIVPNSVTRGGGGGATFAPVTNIDARGSTMTELQFRAIIAENNVKLKRDIDRGAPFRQRRMQMLGT